MTDGDDKRPPPPVPEGSNLQNFPFVPLECRRLRDSDMAAVDDAEGFRAAVLLWCAAWHQLPPASIPKDDKAQCRLAGYGKDLKTWQRAKAAGALNGFVECSDGRMYHLVLAEKVVEAWESKLASRKRTQAASDAKERARHEAEQSARNEHRNDERNDSRNGQRNDHQQKGRDREGIGKGEVEQHLTNPDGLVVPGADAPMTLEPDESTPTFCPPCPHDVIVAAFHELLPGNPKVLDWHETRQAHLRARWRAQYVAGKFKTQAEGVARFRKILGFAAKSAFLTGQAAPAKGGRPFVMTLEWFVDKTNFTKVVEGNFNDA